MSYVSKSPWIIHYDGSSCNGCDIEVLAALTPLYDAERFGVVNTGNPKHADIFVVTGGVNAQNAPVIKQIYDQMLEPKVVVACGACACGGGVYQECYNVLGGTNTVIPVDAYVPGCAVRPEAIIDAVVAGVGILEQKAEQMKVNPDSKRDADAEPASGAHASVAVTDDAPAQTDMPEQEAATDQAAAPAAGEE